MTWDQIEGKWNQYKGSVKQQFGKLTDDDLMYIAGKRESLIGKLQERYAMPREEAQRKTDDWVKTVKEFGTAAPPPQSREADAHHAGKR